MLTKLWVIVLVPLRTMMWRLSHGTYSQHQYQLNEGIGPLEQHNHRLEGVFSRISSGLRINKAGDDAAGLAVAENLAAEQQSLRQAAQNTNDGIFRHSDRRRRDE